MEVVIRGGASVDIPSTAEIREIVAEQERASARGFKWMRLPVLQGKAASNAITLNEQNSGSPLGPDQGYAWSLRRVVVDGMTSGATPDVINMYRSSTGGAPLWQFNGNNFGFTFGKLEMVLGPGDALQFASVGTFTATGLIRVTGELVELPAEMLAKLA